MCDSAVWYDDRASQLYVPGGHHDDCSGRGEDKGQKP